MLDHPDPMETGTQESDLSDPERAEAPGAAPVAIEVRGVEKSFRIPTHRVDSLKERLTSFAPRDYRELRALAASPSRSARASSSASSAATAPARARC